MINLEKFPTNPMAQKMLDTVTKGWYDKSYVGKWMFQVMGQEWEDAEKIVMELPLQVYPETATWGIMYHEILYGLPVDPEKKLEERRAAVIRKRNMRAPLNPDKLEEWLFLTTGVKVHITENVKPYTFKVQFEDMDFVYSLSDLFRELRRAKPSHLAFMYGFGTKVENKNEALLSKIRIKFTVPWATGGYYLEGSFFLDGSVMLGFPDLNPMIKSIRGDGRLREEYISRLTVYKDWWTLDGEYLLDGEKILDAEKCEEVI